MRWQYDDDYDYNDDDYDCNDDDYDCNHDDCDNDQYEDDDDAAMLFDGNATTAKVKSENHAIPCNCASNFSFV